MKKIPKLPAPFVVLGFTTDDKLVLGGAFQMADEKGVPLTDTLQAAQRDGWVVSLVHYFASAIEHGWDDTKTYAAIKSSLEDMGQSADYENIITECAWAFMWQATHLMSRDPKEIGKALRLSLENQLLDRWLTAIFANN